MTKEQELEIVRKYNEELLGCVKLAKEFNTNKYFIRKILKKHGIVARKIRRPDLSSEEMVRLYEEGLNTWEIAEKMGTDQTTVRKRIKKAGKILEASSVHSSRRVRDKNPRWKGYEGISGSYWGSFNASAKLRGIQVLVTIDQVWEVFSSQKGICKLSGYQISLAETNKDLITGQQTASIDRIDSSRDYTLENIQWVHKDVNACKWYLDEDTFLNMCRLVANNAKNQ